MTPDDFRKIALAQTKAVESAHMNHPDFRIGGKIFASLGAPNEQYAMVKLTPEQQQIYVSAASEVFVPCTGAWGARGCTNILLAKAKKSMVREAIESAVTNQAISKPSKKTKGA